MTANPTQARHRTPAVPRFERPNPLAFAAALAAGAFVLSSFMGSGLGLDQLARGVPAMGRILGQMLPPSLEGIDRIL